MAMERIEAWLRVRDGHRFVRDIRDAGRAVRSLGGASHLAGNRLAFASRASYGAGTAATSLGTSVRWAAAGFTLLAAGAVKMGIGFNSTMEQNQVAFGQFLGSAEEVDKMLKHLFKTAAETPFEFADVTTAARKFLAFGFTAKETTSYLDSVGNAIAGIGGGNDEIQRMIIALGQMQAKGRVMGQELLQITELGIPAYQILKEELNLTTEQVRRIGLEGIGADKAITALMRGMDKRFAGAAQKQAKTLAGQWSTFKDVFRQTMGVITKPLFDILRKNVLPAFNRLMPEIQKQAPKAMKAFWVGFTGKGLITPSKLGRTFKTIGEWVRKIGDFALKAFRIAAGAAKELFEALKPAKPLWDNVLWPFIKGLAKGIAGLVVGTFKIAIPVIKGIAIALGFIGKVLKPVSKLFEWLGVAVGLVFGGWFLKALTFIPKIGGALGFMGKGVDFVGKAFFAAGGVLGKFLGIGGRLVGWIVRALAWLTKIPRFFLGLWVKAHVTAYKVVIGNMGKAVGFFARLPGRVISIAGRIVKGAWNGLKSLGTTVMGVIRNAMNDALGFLARMPGRFFDAGVKMAKALIRGVKNLIAAGAGFALDLGKSLANAVIGFLNDAIPNKIPVPHAPDINIPDDPIPTFARGGRINAGGWAWVGEQGPEPMWVPAGASIYPSSSREAASVARKGGRPEPSRSRLATPLVTPERSVVAGPRDTAPSRTGDPRIIQLVVGRRVLAEVVAEEADFQRARK